MKGRGYGLIEVINQACLLCTVLVFCVLCYYLVLSLLPHVYCFTICVLLSYNFSCRMLARSQYPQGPATGHLSTGFSWFPCVYKRMLRWFPRLQVATACFSCSSPDLNFLDPYFVFMSSLFHIYVDA